MFWGSACALLIACGPEERAAPVPVIDGDFRRLVHAPHLDSLQGPDSARQHVVDHGFVLDAEGTWHLWACIRGTKVGRLLFGWKGRSLTGDSVWRPVGVVARALPAWGEQKTAKGEQIQAPFFMKIDTAYYCFYNSAGIRIMTSADGANYARPNRAGRGNLLFDRGGRDVMVMEDSGKYFAYSTISTAAADGWTRGFVSVRTSADLIHWSDYTIVSEGGRAGNGPVSAESPFVQRYGGYYFLFRSSSGSGTTFVYRSKDPYHFGVNDDTKLVAELPVWAPEIIFHDGQWYISDIADFRGVKIARLRWDGGEG